MTIEYNSAIFGSNADLGLDGLLPGRNVLNTNPGHKTCNSLYPLLLGLDGTGPASGGTTVSGFPSHNHQGGLPPNGEFMEQVSGYSSGDKLLGLAGMYSGQTYYLNTWYDCHKDWNAAASPINPPIFIPGPPGSDSVDLYFRVQDISTETYGIYARGPTTKFEIGFARNSSFSQTAWNQWDDVVLARSDGESIFTMETIPKEFVCSGVFLGQVNRTGATAPTSIPYTLGRFVWRVIETNEFVEPASANEHTPMQLIGFNAHFRRNAR